MVYLVVVTMIKIYCFVVRRFCKIPCHILIVCPSDTVAVVRVNSHSFDNFKSYVSFSNNLVHGLSLSPRVPDRSGFECALSNFFHLLYAVHTHDSDSLSCSDAHAALWANRSTSVFFIFLLRLLLHFLDDHSNGVS